MSMGASHSEPDSHQTFSSVGSSGRWTSARHPYRTQRVGVARQAPGSEGGAGHERLESASFNSREGAEEPVLLSGRSCSTSATVHTSRAWGSP